MRSGINPNRYLKAFKYPATIGAVITHLPHTNGYHKERFEIVRTCLESMRRNAGMHLPMMVWDNGSGAELRDWLQDEYKPEFLMLSPNIGKSAARCSMYRMVPLETVLCISDDDMLYYPNWLKPQLDLLNGFPDVGTVSGYPVHTQFNWATETTIKWAEEHADKVERGLFIPVEWEKDLCDSIGVTWEQHQAAYSQNPEVRITYHGMTAYATSHHCQFIAKADVLERFVQWDGVCLSDEKPWDRAIDSQGFLRLTTIDRLVRHMGNVLDDKLRADIEGMGIINGK